MVGRKHTNLREAQFASLDDNHAGSARDGELYEMIVRLVL
jgi:hypothetical protein